MPRKIHIAHIMSQSRHLAQELHTLHFDTFCPPAFWRPAVNMFYTHQSVEICIDLAGVDEGSLDVQVQEQQLIIKGVRLSPEPSAGCDENLQFRVLAMEIENGPFYRSLPLPYPVQVESLRKQSEAGFFWIKIMAFQAHFGKVET